MSANILLLTFDSCRYDVAKKANTPVLNSFAETVKAQSPANYTYAAHMSFFAGILPNAEVPRPLYNRFNQQLMGLVGVGETNLAKKSVFAIESDQDLISGFNSTGYKTIGAGAMTWFKQGTLINRFESFKYTGTDAVSQIDFLSELDPEKKTFGFINFGETHFPYDYFGKKDECRDIVLAREIVWPPQQKEGIKVGSESEGFRHQIEALEYIDSCLPRLFSSLPNDTVVVACGDHGECFGEGGYWGHGFNHPNVSAAPLSIFRLDGRPIL